MTLQRRYYFPCHRVKLKNVKLLAGRDMLLTCPRQKGTKKRAWVMAK